MLLFEAKRLAVVLGFGGRISRFAFIDWYSSLVICALVLVAAASFAAVLVPLEVAALLAVVPLVWAALVLAVRHLHDFSCSGLHALWITTPQIASGEADGAVGTALNVCEYGVLVWLCLTPGSPGPNRFGAAPMPAPANTGGAGDQGQNSSLG